jgi:hypothetical protein
MSALIQQATGICVDNISLIGYAAKDYPVVLRHVLADYGNEYDGIFVGLTLNDVYKKSNVNPSSMEWMSSIPSWLRSHSNLYMALKGTFTDRSKVYYEYDSQWYVKNNPFFKQFLMDIEEVVNIATVYKLPVTFLLFPYEYSLRSSADTDIPGNLMVSECLQRNWDCIHFYPVFKEKCTPPSDCFLFADGIHFSVLGNYISTDYILIKKF